MSIAPVLGLRLPFFLAVNVTVFPLTFIVIQSALETLSARIVPREFVKEILFDPPLHTIVTEVAVAVILGVGVGVLVGALVGAFVGVGVLVGTFVGVGVLVGTLVGAFVGVGVLVGALVGAFVGVGVLVGAFVTVGVGMPDCRTVIRMVLPLPVSVTSTYPLRAAEPEFLVTVINSSLPLMEVVIHAALRSARIVPLRSEILIVSVPPG